MRKVFQDVTALRKDIDSAKIINNAFIDYDKKAIYRTCKATIVGINGFKMQDLL